jgi:hypothetical protein
MARLFHPNRADYQRLFVDQMRKAEAMKAYVREFDEMKNWDKRKTWEWLEDKGQVMFEKDRDRASRLQTINALSGKGESKRVQQEWAAPGTEEDKPTSKSKCGKGAKGKAKKGGEDVASSDGSASKWGDGSQPSTRKNTVLTPEERRQTNGPCWYYTTDSRREGNYCTKAHRKLTDEEKQKMQNANFVNPRLKLKVRDETSTSPKAKVKANVQAKAKLKTKTQDPKDAGMPIMVKNTLIVRIAGVSGRTVTPTKTQIQRRAPAMTVSTLLLHLSEKYLAGIKSPRAVGIKSPPRTTITTTSAMTLFENIIGPR